MTYSTYRIVYLVLVFGFVFATQVAQAQTTRDHNQIVRQLNNGRLTATSSYGGSGIGAGEKTVWEIHLCRGGFYHAQGFTRSPSAGVHEYNDRGYWRVETIRGVPYISTRSVVTGEYTVKPLWMIQEAFKHGSYRDGNATLEFRRGGATCS